MKTFNACCNNCGWRGSEFKLLFSKDGIFCPKCESEDIIQFGKPQTQTPDEIAKGFADWVKVEDRLPENAGWVNDTVMFWSKKHGHALIGCYDFEFDDWTQQPWTEGAEKLKSSDVTHWRPLPAPPGE